MESVIFVLNYETYEHFLPWRVPVS